MREDSDLLQRDAAAAIGITQRKYSCIETGAQQATEEILCKLASFYGTSVEYILKLTDSKATYGKKQAANPKYRLHIYLCGRTMSLSYFI